MCSVRGIGVADMVSTSICAAHLLQPLLVAHAEALLLVDDQQAEVVELDVLARAARCVPMRMSTLPAARLLRGSPSAPWRVRKREIISTSTGKCAKRRLKVSKCWKASTVVGASTATCLPSCTALKAARMATSVLP